MMFNARGWFRGGVLRSWRGSFVARAVTAVLLIAVVLPVSSARAQAGGCEPEWSEGIGAPGMNNWVHALTIFDDGAGGGPALYAAGQFTIAGGLAANRVARWNGSNWSPLGAGASGSVFALTVFDDGSGGGPALYVGGDFTTDGGMASGYIARWGGCASAPPPRAPPPLPCPGDANNDGKVNCADITSVLSNWLADYTPNTGPGDANHDGLVNFIDITSVLNNWLAVCP